MNASFLQRPVELIWCSEFILGVGRDGLNSSGAGAKHRAQLVLCKALNFPVIQLNIELSSALGNFKMSTLSVEPKPSSFDQDIHRTRWACHSAITHLVVLELSMPEGQHLQLNLSISHESTLFQNPNDELHCNKVSHSTNTILCRSGLFIRWSGCSKLSSFTLERPRYNDFQP